MNALPLLAGQTFPALLDRTPGQPRPAILAALLQAVACQMADARGLSLPRAWLPLSIEWRGGRGVRPSAGPVEESATGDSLLDAARARLPDLDWASLPPILPGDLYSALLADRHRRGSYYTPLPLACDTARRTLEPLLDHAIPTVLDPAAGGGHFLLAAGEIAAAWLEAECRLPSQEARRRTLAHLYGIERDPLAADLCALALWLWAADPDLPLNSVRARIAASDALLDPLPAHFPAIFDAVIGNPPFASVFTRAHDDPARRAALRARYRTARGSFDLSVPFVERALGLTRPGGRCGLVLPNKLLAADYARPLRRWLADSVTVEAIADWSRSGVFEAGVYPVACIFEKTAPRPDAPLTLVQFSIQRHDTVPLPVYGEGTGVGSSQSDLHTAPADLWSPVFDPLWPVLRRCFERTRPLADVATLAAGLTVAEAYDLRPNLLDLAEDEPLRPGVVRWITSGLIRPYHTLWGRQPARYLNFTYGRPAIPLDALPPRRRQQAATPKLIVAGMGQQPRALYDPGAAQASVATTIITGAAFPLPALCAILNSRLIARLYRALFGGLALSGGYLRFTRRELGLLPIPDLPPDHPDLVRLNDLAAAIADPTHPARRGKIDTSVCKLYRIPADLLDD